MSRKYWWALQDKKTGKLRCEFGAPRLHPTRDLAYQEQRYRNKDDNLDHKVVKVTLTVEV